MTMRVAVHTLGCKLNYAESSTVAREFARRGYEVVSHTEEADIYIAVTRRTAILSAACTAALQRQS